MISGIISTILILFALIAIPFGIKRNRRILKEMTALSMDLNEKTTILNDKTAQLDQKTAKLHDRTTNLDKLSADLGTKTKSLLEAIESLVGKEEVVEPSTEEAYRAKYREFDIEGDLEEVPFIRAREIATKLEVPDVFLMKTLLSFTKESTPTSWKEYIGVRVAKREIPYEKAEKIINKSGSNWAFRTSSQYPLTQKEHVYA